MSDFSLLSYQYQGLADLVRRLKAWVLRIRAERDAYTIEDPDVEGVDLATATVELESIVRFLSEVIALENEGAWPEHWISNSPLPTVVVDQLRDAHANDMSYYLDRLGRLSDHLRSGIAALTKKDMELLDEIVLATDEDANAVFERLMRWR